MGYGVSKFSNPDDMAISHAAELLTLEPARTNDGSEWECQLCTVLSAAGESSYRMCRAPLVSVPPVRCRHRVQPSATILALGP